MRSGPHTNTASVFAASLTSATSAPRSRAAASTAAAESTRTARWLSSGVSPSGAAAAVQANESVPDDEPVVLALEAEPGERRRRGVRVGDAQLGVVEVVVELAVRAFDEAEHEAFGRVQRRDVAVACGDQLGRQPLERPSQVADAQDDAHERPGGARAGGVEQGQLALARIHAERG